MIAAPRRDPRRYTHIAATDVRKEVRKETDRTVEPGYLHLCGKAMKMVVLMVLRRVDMTGV